MPTESIPPVTPKPRGFAAIPAERRKEISSKGGRAAHAQGKAHQFTREEAQAAGRKGGKAHHVRRGPVPKALVPATPTQDGDSVQ